MESVLEARASVVYETQGSKHIRGWWDGLDPLLFASGILCRSMMQSIEHAESDLSIGLCFYSRVSYTC